MKKFLVTLAVLAIAAFATAQVYQYPGTLKEPVYAFESAPVAGEIPNVSILIRYVGTTPSVNDTVTVEADGNLTFQQNGAADTTLECPVALPLGGIIDVSDGACNTIGKVVDVINASPDWEAVIVDGLRTDSSNNVWIAAVAADATQKAGLPIRYESTTAFNYTRAVTNLRTFDAYFPAERANGTVLDNPYFGTYEVLQSLSWMTDYDAGTSQLIIYAVTPRRGGEDVVTLWSSASAATDTFASLGPANWGPQGLIAPLNSKIVVRISNSADQDYGTLAAYALRYQR